MDASTIVRQRYALNNVDACTTLHGSFQQLHSPTGVYVGLLVSVTSYKMGFQFMSIFRLFYYNSNAEISPQVINIFLQNKFNYIYAQLINYSIVMLYE